jgi:ArsR family transcriptional regulator, lead/cadmium/zinc/bismuth-responsive transcriptional repressor
MFAVRKGAALTAQTATDLCEQHVVDAGRVQEAAAALPSQSVLDELAETFKVLSSPTRLKIIHALSRGELCVCDLAGLLGATESAVSHQLRLLRGMRLVKYRREGKLAFYSLDDQHVQQLFEAGLEHMEEENSGGVGRG